METKIQLGSGDSPLAGFVNVDILPSASGVDVIADISKRLPIADHSVDMIYASHVLEHFPTAEVPGLLREWRRVLRDGGELLVSVPDLDTIARVLLERPGWFTPPHDPWLGALYGGQKDAYDFHKTGFTDVWLTYLLDQSGFGDTSRVERFADVGAADTSYSSVPFGVNVALNMRAVAGGRQIPHIEFEASRLERSFNLVDKVIGRAMKASTRSRSALMQRRRRRLEHEIRREGGA
jgi:predicted SAM-dependent methyltransferase